MRKLLFVALLGTSLLLAARPAQANLTEGCCACVPELGLGQGAGQREVAALFCQLVIGVEAQPFADRCESAGGVVVCSAMDPNTSCTEVLLESNIRCPDATGAPAASLLGVVALAGGLAAGGILLLRQRRA